MENQNDVAQNQHRKNDTQINVLYIYNTLYTILVYTATYVQ